MDYWKECIVYAAEDCGLAITEEQLQTLAEAVRDGHENYGMAYGHDYGRPAESQAEQALRKLRREVEARDQWQASSKPCPDCRTYGYVLDGWGRDQTCDRCDAKGRVPM